MLNPNPNSNPNSNPNFNILILDLHEAYGHVRSGIHQVYGIGPTLVAKLDLLLSPLKERLDDVFIADTRLTRLLVLMGLGNLRSKYMEVLKSNPKV